METTPPATVITVPHSRLAWGVFGEKAGDIQEAYSGECLAIADCKKALKTFWHNGSLWTNGGGGGHIVEAHADCYELLPADSYQGPDHAPFSHEGERVTFKKIKYRLGPKTIFRPLPRTIDEWRHYLRSVYKNGGYFSYQTDYHAYLRTEMEHTLWDPSQCAYVPIADRDPIYPQACAAELTTPNYRKSLSAYPLDQTVVDDDVPAEPELTLEPKSAATPLSPSTKLTSTTMPPLPLWKQRRLRMA